MRRKTFALAAVLPLLLAGGSSGKAGAQSAGGLFGPTKVERAVRTAESLPLRDLADGGVFNAIDTGAEAPRTIRNHSRPNSDPQDVDLAPEPDAVVQQSITPLLATPPIANFEGLSSNDNLTLFLFRVLPPDTVGDVGPAHYVQMTNLALQVFNKAGVPLITPVVRTSSFWAPLGGICATDDLGDPIVLYDDMADRWLISQFNSEDFDIGPHHQCIGISKTGDPTGTYFLYDFVMPNLKFNDYPKFGVWRDAYYMTDNQFAPFFQGVGAFAFDRAKMLVGDPAAAYIYFDLNLLDPFIFGLLPADADGLVTPPDGAPGLFTFFTANEFGDPEGDGLRLFELRANFATPAASTFTELPFLATAAFNPLTPPGRDDLEQPPPANNATMALDSISERLMHRLQYRNFGAYESLVTNHTVNVGTGNTQLLHRAGIRYYELRRALPGGAWAVQEQATFSPNTDNRWMGSAAMDGEGNLALGYSVSSLTTFPSIRYAGRLATDPPGGLQPEQTLIAGTGVQTSTLSRWGDYSAMAIDPSDDCTFWYTQEYYTAAGQAASTAAWQTRIGSFKMNPNCHTSPRGLLSGHVSNFDTSAPISGALVEVSNGFSRVTLTDGSYSMYLAPGTYTVTASAFGYLPSEPETIHIEDGGTYTLDFCLRPIPVIVGISAVLTSENCTPGNGVIDPGERVRVDITLQNIGPAATRGLRARLLEEGGVTNASGQRSYGRLDPGESGTRNFAFTADGVCGGQITMRLHVHDNRRDLGIVEFTARLGERIVLPTVAFANPAPITIPDNAVAVPYPSAINVGGVEGTIDKVTVSLQRLSHTFPADTIFLLVGPGGQSTVLMAGAGGGADVVGVNLTFDDAAASFVPTPIVSGTYRPTGNSGTLPVPAPPAPYGTKLSNFRGTDPNGTWRLFVVDAFAFDSGVVSDGWSLNITPAENRCSTECGRRPTH